MAAQDDLLAHTAEVQDALRHSLQESGTAGTGPVQLPPPADFTSEQSHSPASADPLSYSNTLKVQLYRGAEGKVWTQPGPGHESSDLEMRIRKVNGKWHVVTEVSHVVSRVKRKGHTYTTIQSDAISTSGAPTDYELPSDQGHGWSETDREGHPVTPSEVRNRERFEDFSPVDAKTAMRQAITKLQQKGAIYAPAVPGPSGNASNALFAAAAIAALAAAAAFAGIGPFATQAAAAPPAATAVPSAAKTLAAPVKLTGSGSIAFSLPARYGTSPTITEYLCQNVFLPPPSGATAEEPAMGLRGLLNGRTYTAFFSATRTQVIFENVSATPAMFGAAPPTFILGQRAAGTVPVQTGPQTTPSQSGTVTIDLTCVGAGATTPAQVTVAPGPVATTVAPGQPLGPSPWAPGLAALAVAAAGAALATKAGIGPLAAAGLVGAPERQGSQPSPSCVALVAQEARLLASVAKYDKELRSSPGGHAEYLRRLLQMRDLESHRLDRVREALGRCRASEGPDELPAEQFGSTTPFLDAVGRFIERPAGRRLAGMESLGPDDHGATDAAINRATDSGEPGFEPLPPTEAQDDDEPKERPTID